MPPRMGCLQGQPQLSPCDVAALEKCLKESKGDTKKVRPWLTAAAAASQCRRHRRCACQCSVDCGSK